MRAVLLKHITNLTQEEVILIEGDSAKHLVKVVRVKKGERILILNGAGLRAEAFVTSLDKKSLTISIELVDQLEQVEIIDLAICTPKKDAIEDIVRDCVELGINNLFPIESSFSQSVLIKNERLERIIESGMIQANNPYFLNLLPMGKFQSLEDLSKKYQQVIYCSSKKIESSQIDKLNGKTLIIIGPEAGLSSEEELLIEKLDNSYAIHFPSYILRAPTAVSVASGFVFSKLQ